MPPMGNKGKKGKEGRQSRSRNTTPSSVVSAPASAVSSSTAYLDIPIVHLSIPTNILYDDLLDRHGGSGGIPDPKHLESLAIDLKTLNDLARQRDDACARGMRELSGRRKDIEREQEQAAREAEEKANLKRAAEDDELDRGRKAGKLKKRKDQSSAREERPLAHGAHGIARQDGLGVASKASATSTPARSKQASASGSSSSLSPPSQLQSPTMATTLQTAESSAVSPTRSMASDDSHQPPPAASVPQYQTFGSNPLAFDDPTIYHIRDVHPSMSDEEKKEIYCVASFPHDDLHDVIAGTPPDKDFSNAKPSNQVNANTFATYLEPYLRPLTEEDMAFLKERGDRTTPFLMPARGKKHYTEVWAEEDGSTSIEISQQSMDKLSPNQARGSIDQMDDETAGTDKISMGPVSSRLLSTMRYEHRPSPNEDKANGTANGNGEFSTNGLTNGEMNAEHSVDANNDDGLPPATAFPESSSANWKVPTAKLDYQLAEEKVKAELRYLGFIGPEDEPNFDAHNDDEVSQRLRFLQGELKTQMEINGARKARIAQIAAERMAHQEFSTILDDLDSQVQQSFAKRSRTMGKGKKNTKRPGGAGGGSHYTTGGNTGMAKPGIGDQAKTLMERRLKWISTIKPVFSDDVTRVRTEGETIFGEAEMTPLLAAEREKWDEGEE